MADVTKRLRYFDGQVLGAQDFTDEQHYLLDRQRRYSRFFHAAGIVDGLEVRQVAVPGQIEVRHGTALDAQGRQVVLSDTRTVSLAERTSQTVELVIAYSEESSDPQPIAAESGGHTRFYESPYVGPNPPLPPGSTAPLTLARVRLDANGAVTEIDETPRVYAGIRLPDGQGTTGGVILRAHTRPDNLDQPGWHDVTYVGIWQRHDATYNPVQYWKDSQGIVYFRGLRSSGSLPPDDDTGLAFTLPAGYRPAHRQLHGVGTFDDTLGRVDVLANGNVVVVNGNTTWVSLDNIAFRAADSLVVQGPAEEVLPRIVSGVVDSDGTAPAIVGFTVARVSTGLYDITFAPAFAATPAATVTQIGAGSGPEGGDTRDNAVLVSLERDKMRVKTGDGTGAAVDRRFSFMAIGPR